MIRQLATGLVSGAIAVVALTVTRPVPQPSAEARGRWLDARDLRGAIDPPRTAVDATRPATRPTFDKVAGRTRGGANRDPELAKLEKVMPEFRAANEPLSAALGRVRDFAGLNMVVDWRALEAAGVAADAPVTLSVRDLPARRVLRLILRAASSSKDRLTYLADDGVIVVSTDERMSGETATRVYDIRDLIGVEYTGEPVLPTSEPTYTPMERIDALVRLIQETVAPTVWRDAGGSVGSIRAYAGRLIVTLPDDLHAEVEWILALLRDQ